MELKIEDDIPIPRPKVKDLVKVLKTLKVHQSVWVPASEKAAQYYDRKRVIRENPGTQFTSRSVDGGCRIWRIQ